MAVAACAAKLWSSARSSTPKGAASWPARLIVSTPRGRSRRMSGCTMRLRTPAATKRAVACGERADLLPPRALDREQARVLEREGGLIGEGLQQRRLAVGEDAPAAVGDAEGADDHALGTHRHRQHGHVARGAEVRAQVVGHAR